MVQEWNADINSNVGEVLDLKTDELTMQQQNKEHHNLFSASNIGRMI
jgi:hypothetical protein